MMMILRYLYFAVYVNADRVLMIFFMISYITIEELEQALREFGMNDGKDIKEIISEVDADNVSTESQYHGHEVGN